MVAFCQRLVASTAFQVVILGLILVSALIVGLETSPDLVRRTGGQLSHIDQWIVGLFVVELIIRLVACGRRWWEFFRDPWNVFDFLVVAVCVLPLGAPYAAVLRLARVLRVLRLVTALPGLQLLVMALLKSIPSMGYVGVLLMLHFYVYAVVGVFLFGTNDPVHFGNLGRAMLSLFQTVTLEGWVDLMRIQMDGSAASGLEVAAGETATSRAQPVAGILYFVTFILLGTMIILNLLIGVIMKAMEEAREERAEVQAARRGEVVATNDAELAAIESDLADLARRLERVRQRARQ